MSPTAVPVERRLVGREPQLALIGSHLRDLADRRGILVLLTGEAGIGKSRLAEETVVIARRNGARSCWSSAWAGEGAPPLWPWVQILRQLGRPDDMLDRFAPESPGASEAARFAQADAMATIVRSEAERGPLVLVLDDLHWADSATVRVLSFVASAATDVGCLIVATYRPEDLASDHVAELARVGTTLALPRLDHVAASELLRSAVGGDLSPSATDAVVQRSAGNPLFVWEFGQLMAQSGRLDVAPAAVPDAVSAVLERRLARLSEPAVEMLRLGAIAGQVFAADVVAAVGAVPLEQAAAGLDMAATARLIEPSAAGDGFQFGHALIRDVVVHSISPDHRADLHRRAATYFAHRTAADPSLHAVVADHLERAGAAPDAAPHWEAAAGAAATRLAHGEAAALYARARHASPEPVQQVASCIREGECLLLTGALEEARKRFEEAASLARTAAAPELFARAVLGIGTGAVAWEVPLADNAHTALVTEALAGLPEHAVALRSMLLARLSVTAASPGTTALARHRAREACALAEAVGDPLLMAQALAAVNDAHGGPAHAGMRRENADTIVELAIGSGDRMLALLGYRFRVVADLEVGDIAAVDRSIAAFSRLAEQLQQPLVSWYVPLFAGMRALLRGDLIAAESACEAVEAAAQRTGSANAIMLGITQRMGIDIAAGRRPDAPSMHDLYPVEPVEWASYAAGMAMLAWHSDDAARAHELLRLHADDGFAHLGDDAEHLTTLVLFGRLAVYLGDLDAAARIRELLAPHAGMWAVDGIAACCWGPVDLELGRMALAAEDHADALHHLTNARVEADRAGAVLVRADIDRLLEQCDAGPGPGPVVLSGESAATFAREGQLWTLAFRGRTVRMRDSKGLRDLAALIACAGRELHVLDLAGQLDPHRRSPDSRESVGAPGGDLGELLDAQARSEFRRRLDELDDEIDDAERCADPVRLERARAERDFIAAELAAALGLGGRARRPGNPAERARKAVTGRIRLAIGRIDQEHPALGRHLANSVRTGTYCSYQPESPLDWRL